MDLLALRPRNNEQCVGCSRERAFEMGKIISDRVTKMNPAPVKLNFEKARLGEKFVAFSSFLLRADCCFWLVTATTPQVYHPCVLMAKKRYVGWKFESHAQSEGVFDAKGMHTLRSFCFTFCLFFVSLFLCVCVCL
jgi:DNA polymerase zeta